MRNYLEAVEGDRRWAQVLSYEACCYR